MCTKSPNIDGATVNDTTKSPSMLLEIEKHLKIVNASESIQGTIDSYFVS